MTLVRDQHELQAVQVEDRSADDVRFIASSSNGVRTDKWWRCTSEYNEGWFLPSYDASSWPSALVGNNITEFHFIASDAKWIGSIFTTNIIYCRRNTTLGKQIYQFYYNLMAYNSFHQCEVISINKVDKPKFPQHFVRI